MGPSGHSAISYGNTCVQSIHIGCRSVGFSYFRLRVRA